MARGVAQTGGEVRVDENVDLAGCVADQRRTHQRENVTHALVLQIPAWPPRETRAPDARQLKRKLRGAADHNAERHAADWTDSETTVRTNNPMRARKAPNRR